MSANWRDIVLGDVAGGTGLFRDGDWIETKDQDPKGGVRLIQLADIGEGEYLDRSSRFLTLEKANELKCTFLEEGDLLVARMPDPLGRACVFPGDPKPSVTAVDVCIVRPDTAVVNTHWLKWAVNSWEFRSKLERFATGTTRKRISRTKLQAMPLKLPPLPEQRRIAAILDKADAVRRKRQQTLDLADNFLRSAFLDLFGDPVTNPKGWEVVSFKSVGTTRLGKMLDKGKEVGDCQFPYLANTNVQWGRFNMEELRTMDFSKSDRKEFKLEDGDVLICEGGEIGRTAIWRGEHEDVFFQKALHRVRLDRTVTVPEYVYHFMWFMAKNGGFRRLTTSATIAHLTGVKLKRLPIPLPPLDLQRRFAAIIESAEHQQPRQRVHLAKLDTLFGSLQQRAFRGELSAPTGGKL